MSAREEAAAAGDLERRIERLERQQRVGDTYSVAAFWRAVDRLYDLGAKDRRIACIVCGHEGGYGAFEELVDRCAFGGGVLKRHVCPKCDCVFGPLKYLDMDEEFVGLDYRMLYAHYSESNSLEAERRTFDALGPSRTGPYLNWGCGGVWSTTVSTLRADGFDVWGYEPSVEESAGHVVRTRGEISARFAGIFSNNVIEHFRTPLAEFRYLATVLEDGGRMAHSSPCYEYRYTHTRFHTLFLLGRSPYVLAERMGFRASRVAADGEYINFLFERDR